MSVIEAFQFRLRGGDPQHGGPNLFANGRVHLAEFRPAYFVQSGTDGNQFGASHLRAGNVFVEALNLPAQLLLVSDASMHSFQVEGDEIRGRVRESLRERSKQLQTPVEQSQIMFAV